MILIKFKCFKIYGIVITSSATCIVKIAVNYIYIKVVFQKNAVYRDFLTQEAQSSFHGAGLIFTSSQISYQQKPAKRIHYFQHYALEYTVVRTNLIILKYLLYELVWL